MSRQQERKMERWADGQDDWPDRPFGFSEERSLSSKYCVGALCNANQVAPVGAINSNVIRIRPQCENGHTAP